jgi:hypothetical protein
MEAAAHTKGGFGGVTKKDGKEFVHADKNMKDGGVAQSLKKAGFYEKGKSKPERLSIIKRVTTKPQRVEIVDETFANKKLKKGGSAKQAAIAIHMKERGIMPKHMTKKSSGGGLKEVPEDNKGLSKLPEQVRHKMGYMAEGGKPGLYANINAKRKRIEHEKAQGLPVEHMRKVGSKGAPTKDAFVQSAKTAKVKSGGSMKKSGGCEW